MVLAYHDELVRSGAVTGMEAFPSRSVVVFMNNQVSGMSRLR